MLVYTYTLYNSSLTFGTAENVSGKWKWRIKKGEIKHEIEWNVNFCKSKTMAVKWEGQNIGGQIIEEKL